MSWEAAGFIKKQSCCPDGSPMSRGQKFLLLVLADYHDTRKKVAYPSVRTLAEDVLASVRQVVRDLNYLEEHFALVRQRARDGRGGNYSYQFVGLDVTLEQAKSTPAATEEPCHPVTFFSAAKRVTEGCRKGDTTSSKRVTEGCQEANRYKEEPEPTPSKEPEGACRASVSYADRAREFEVNRTLLVEQFIRDVNVSKVGLVGVRDYDGAFKRLVLRCAGERRIPPWIALAIWKFSERECEQAEGATKQRETA